MLEQEAQTPPDAIAHSNPASRVSRPTALAQSIGAFHRNWVRTAAFWGGAGLGVAFIASSCMPNWDGLTAEQLSPDASKGGGGGSMGAAKGGGGSTDAGMGSGGATATGTGGKSDVASSSSSAGSGGAKPACTLDADCNGQSCVSGVCVDSCEDRRRDGNETDTDCGGDKCPACANGSTCKAATDCTSNACNAMHVCVMQSCNDGLKDQDETDTDCGGSCAPKQQCQPTQHCSVASDCVSYLCDSNGTGTCQPADTVSPTAAIDDMECGCQTILPIGGRVGDWFPFGDGTGTMAGPTATTIPGGRGASKFAQHVTGTAFSSWGAGIGFDFDNPTFGAQSKQPYDASGYVGIKFWGRSDTSIQVRMEVLDEDTYAYGGVCTPASKCSDHFQAPVQLTSQWGLYKILFTSLKQQNYGEAFPAVNPSQLIGCQFQVPVGQAFDFWVDDISFF